MSIKRPDQPHDISWESLRAPRHQRENFASSEPRRLPDERQNEDDPSRDTTAVRSDAVDDQANVVPIGAAAPVPASKAAVSGTVKSKAKRKPSNDPNGVVTFITRVFMPEPGYSPVYDEIVRAHAEEPAFRGLLRKALAEYPKALATKQGRARLAYPPSDRFLLVHRRIDKSTYLASNAILDPYGILTAKALAQSICHHAVSLYLQRLDRERRDEEDV